MLARALLKAAAVGLLGLAGTATAVTAIRARRPHRTRSTAKTVVTAYKGRWGSQLAVELKGQKLSLFEFTKDAPGKSACYGRCAKKWYPLIDRGKIVVRGRGVSRKHLATFRRRDGSLQIEYWGQPLYRCYKNKKTGQDDGMNEWEFGGSWGLVGAAGSPVPPDAYGPPPPPNC